MIQGPLAARKPDGIDFVGNSKISSFCKNPPPNSPIPYIWYYHTLFGRRRRAAFRRAASNASIWKTAHAGPGSAPPGHPARQPDQQPDRHHQGGAEQEVAPQPADGVESHIPDFPDQLLDAVKNVPRIEPGR